MPSDTVLNFVNKALRITGDYEPLGTVVSSPANIADRIVDYANIVLDDVTRKIEFSDLDLSFSVVATGIDNEYVVAGALTRPNSALTCTVGTTVLEEVSRQKLHEIRAQNLYTGQSRYFARFAGTIGELGVDIYPLPPAGETITVLGSLEATKFTVADASVTEIQADDLILLGIVAHMDSYSGMERGYMQLYEAAKARAWKDTFEHQALRVECEDYH